MLQYDFLLHAMLALSASDLANSRTSSDSQASELTNTGLGHRVKAISALNTAIGAPLQSFKQGNAMLATCFVLVFQSVLMDDGLIEYMSFIRGVIAVSIHSMFPYFHLTTSKLQCSIFFYSQN